MRTNRKDATRDITVSGEVQWLYRSSPEFSAGLLLTDQKAQVRFRGQFLVNAGDRVTFSGRMVTHPTYGEQLDVIRLTYDLELEPAGLAHYLETNPAFHGIGPVKSRQIAQAFGHDFDRIIREAPERLREVAQLSADDLATLQREWLARAEMNALASWLSAYGLTHCQLTKIVERFGQSANALLTEDPYLLCREVEGFGFARTDDVARKLGIPKEHPGRITAALRDLIGQQVDDGHCWMSEQELMHTALQVLALDELDAESRIREGLHALVEGGELVAEGDGSERKIALPQLYARERELAAWFRRSRQLPPEGLSAGRLKRLLEIYAVGLTYSQRKAIRMALASRVCLITGAAGSGKSYTIASIESIFDAQHRSVALAAPTGKAAKRLEELCGCRAMTLHRLLGYNGRDWQYHAEHPLDVDVVIVDEVSMVDIHLAWHLCQAIDLERTQVILVGDHHQLPPVGPGHLLRDLLLQQLIPSVVLDQVVRQAGTLKENSTAILSGTLAPTAPGSPGLLRPWYVIDGLRESSEVVQALLALLESKLPALGLDPIHDVQVLTPYRKGPLGAKRLNAEVQRVMQRLRYDRDLPPVSDETRTTLYLGDKVMQTRNNYTLDLMNGAIGTILENTVVPTEHGTQRVWVVDFDGRQVNIPVGSDAAKELTLAYVATVHKCQGSEFPCVIAILHRMHSYMLQRNLLYTAVTRASHTAILLGDRLGMRRALDNTTVDARRTWLSVWGTHV